MTEPADMNTEEKNTLACTFCRGTGIDPFGLLHDASRCQVCGGRGRISVYGMVRPCAYCRGTAVQPQRRMVCTVCSGKGVVSAVKLLKTCPDCVGKGLRPGQYLPCLTCGGKGVVINK